MAREFWIEFRGVLPARVHTGYPDINQLTIGISHVREVDPNSDAEKDYQGMREFKKKFIDCDHELRFYKKLAEELADTLDELVNLVDVAKDGLLVKYCEALEDSND